MSVVFATVLARPPLRGKILQSCRAGGVIRPMFKSKFILGKPSLILTVFAVGVSAQSEAAIFVGATSRSEFELIYRSEVFSESRNFSNYGRSTTLSVESGMGISPSFHKFSILPWC
jgi:hypothetical protein